MKKHLKTIICITIIITELIVMQIQTAQLPRTTSQHARGPVHSSAVKYTAEQLHNIFEANELTISNMYGDTITVTGTIDRVSKMSTFIPGAGDPVIFLNDETVRCQLYKGNNNHVAQLRAGQTVTITGTVDYPWMGMVCINRGNIN